MKKNKWAVVGGSVTLGILSLLLAQSGYAKFVAADVKPTAGLSKSACYAELEDGEEGEIVIQNAADLADVLAADAAADGSDYSYDGLGRLILKPCTGIAISGGTIPVGE